MKKKLFGALPTAIIFILIWIFGGRLGGNPAVTYNNRIVGYHTSIAVKIVALLKSLEERNPKDMNKKLEALQLQITNSLIELSQMESFDGYTRLRDAAIAMCKFYKSIASNEIVEMIKILSYEDSFISQADISRLQDIKKEISDREAEYGYELQAAQKEFTKMHGIKSNKIPELDR